MLKKLFVLSILCTFILGACTKATPIPATPAPTLDTAATEAAQAAASTQSAQETAQAIQAASAKATLDAQATLDGQATQNVAATATQKILNSRATSTAAASKKITSTAQAYATATEQARPVLAWVQRLFDEGVTTTTEGEYFHLDDFNESVANLGSGTYWRSGYSANNFILSANVTLTSAYDKADLQQSSCGFIFGEESNRSYDLADVAMDGFIYMWNCRGGKCIPMAVMKYGPKMATTGQVNIALMVFEGHIHFYVDDIEIVSAADTRYKAGDLAYLIRSGTNKSFGTRCQMTNVGLWQYP